jgi:hypothetical protein
LLGAALAITLWRWGRWLVRAPQEEIQETESRATKGAVACGKAVERLDGVLRSWPAAGLSLVILVIALGEPSWCASWFHSLRFSFSRPL